MAPFPLASPSGHSSPSGGMETDFGGKNRLCPRILGKREFVPSDSSSHCLPASESFEGNALASAGSDCGSEHMLVGMPWPPSVPFVPSSVPGGVYVPGHGDGDSPPSIAPLFPSAVGRSPGCKGIPYAINSFFFILKISDVVLITGTGKIPFSSA